MAVSERKTRETEALRERVLDLAEDIMVREGVHQITMRRIAAAIDYAPTVLYRLFTDKADLMDHLIARGYVGVRDRYAAVASAKTDDPVDHLREILRVYVDYALSHPNHYRMWFDTSDLRLDDDGPTMNHGRLEFAVYGTWLDAIDACRESGLFDGRDTLEVFQILWSRVHGLISLRLQHPDFPWLPVARHLDDVVGPLSG